MESCEQDILAIVFALALNLSLGWQRNGSAQDLEALVGAGIFPCATARNATQSHHAMARNPKRMIITHNAISRPAADTCDALSR